MPLLRVARMLAEDPRDRPPAPTGEPPDDEPTEVPPAREQPDFVDPKPTEAPLIAG